MSSSGSPGPAPTRLTSGGLGWGLVCVVVEGVLRMPVKLLVFGAIGKGAYCALDCAAGSVCPKIARLFW